jgi:hypothetical protein
VSVEPPPLPGQEFEQDLKLDKPGIVGARWWHKALVEDESAVRRRDVLKSLAVAGGVAGAIGLAGYTLTRAFNVPKEKVGLGSRRAIDMQRLYGWDFGARGEPLVFNGKTEQPFVRSALLELRQVMTPARFRKYAVGTLVESLFAEPQQKLPEPNDSSLALDGADFHPLADVLVPISAPAMERAYRAGEAFARVTAGRSGLAALVDMPGPQAAAFAAGAAAVYEPVLLLDNWPHPHGVVPSHLTLSALAYYQPRFAEQSAQRPASAPPLFVLDRARLTSYSEASDRFDNRYYANPPSLASLSGDGVTALFYVVAGSGDLPEPGDLNRVLAEGTRTLTPGRVAVRALAANAFRGDRDTPSSPVWYGGEPATDAGFWDNYPFDPAYRRAPGQKGVRSSAAEHDFVVGTTTAPPPANVGKVAVLVTASGLLLGAALDRRGSMNRFSGGWAG